MIALARLPDWEARLGAYLDGLAGVTFGYDHAAVAAHHDCCTFAAGTVIALTGVDAMAEFRGHYCTRLGSLRALRRYGAGGVEATLDTKFAQVRRAFAQRGDLVLLPAEAGGMIGTCLGADAVFVGREGDREGLVRFPRSAWTRCWAIG